MKKILITGKNSYIGNSVESWLAQWSQEYEVDTLDMLDEAWRDFNFTKYDVVFHVAGIAHRKDAPDDLYEKVNHLLAVKTAEKAKNSGVSQFIFMSTGAVYSQSDRHNSEIIIRKNTELNPCTSYGISKKKAEEDITQLVENSNMKLVILRPPMVYGRNARGNYSTLAKLSSKTPIFPKVNNKRSMIYISNLCEFIRLAIDNEIEGIYLPQNKEYVDSSNLVYTIGLAHGKKIILTSIFNWAIRLLSYWINVVNKVFGTYYYEKDEEYFSGAYQVVDFKTSIFESEQEIESSDEKNF